MADENFINIDSFDYDLCTVFDLNPVKYNFSGDSRNFLGFIAQDLILKVPEAVRIAGNPNEQISIRMDSISPLIVKGIQQIKPQRDDNKDRLDPIEVHLDFFEGLMDDIEDYMCQFEGDHDSDEGLSATTGWINFLIHDINFTQNGIIGVLMDANQNMPDRDWTIARPCGLPVSHPAGDALNIALQVVNILLLFV